MARALQFQDPGEGIREAEVLEVLVSSGDHVSEGQDVLRIETDKAEFPVSAAFDGTVEEVLVQEGDVIRVGDDLLRISEGDEAADHEESNEEEAGEAEKRAKGKKAKQERPEGKRRRKRREEETGEERGEDEEEEREEPGPEAPGRGDEAEDAGEGPVPASPATRRVARELGVDLREVRPSGEGGRVLTDDVRAHAERGGAAEETGRERERVEERQPERGRKRRREREPSELPDFSRWGPVEREPLRSVRRTTARRMARSWEEIPHVTHNDLADVTELEAFRRRHAPEIEARGGRLTLTVLVLKAVAAALGEHPRFNASLDPEAEEIVLKRYYHIGVALDSERGLLVPTLRDVDRKSLSDLAVELRELAERVRAGEVTPRDMAGGTFTVSNVGPLGGTHFTPIINHPQVAILGLARARLQPVIRGTLEDYEIVPRLLLPLSLGFDHRLIDGADAARFAGRIIEMLGDVESFALSV